ncbi:hypothetical protein GJ496_001631 [Pomphorhynchus laevis]|nr:hypothetical protein GJ496_001631 [Pomphorhynchus laevis]
MASLAGTSPRRHGKVRNIDVAGSISSRTICSSRHHETREKSWIKAQITRRNSLVLYEILTAQCRRRSIHVNFFRSRTQLQLEELSDATKREVGHSISKDQLKLIGRRKNK